MSIMWFRCIERLWSCVVGIFNDYRYQSMTSWFSEYVLEYRGLFGLGKVRVGFGGDGMDMGA